VAMQAQTAWKLEKSSQGVDVYTRRIPESTIKEFKAIVVIEAGMKAIVDIVQDVKHHPDWMYGLKSAEVLKEDPKILQYVRRAPFPFTDRYVVMTSQTEGSEDSCLIALEHLDYPASKEADGLVEIESIKGHWLFKKLDENTTSVAYQFVSDPGGNLPEWLVNSFILKTPYLTLKNLRDMME
jgi:ribosome-associated toxin RatA of RatAB toxin-antitoxin module